MRRLLYCDISPQELEVVVTGASSASKKKFQLANRIYGKLATPVLAIHKPNFDVWGSLVSIVLIVVVPRVPDSPVAQTQNGCVIQLRGYKWV